MKRETAEKAYELIVQIGMLKDNVDYYSCYAADEYDYRMLDAFREELAKAEQELEQLKDE